MTSTPFREAGPEATRLQRDQDEFCGTVRAPQVSWAFPAAPNRGPSRGGTSHLAGVMGRITALPLLSDVMDTSCPQTESTGRALPSGGAGKTARNVASHCRWAS